MPLRTVFGWQKPCYLVGEGYVETFQELMEGTEWDDYGVGRYEKCANCMVHCGFEGTAVTESISRPLEFMKLAKRGIRTEGAMAPDIDLSRQRPALDVHTSQVAREVEKIRIEDPEGYRRARSTASL